MGDAEGRHQIKILSCEVGWLDFPRALPWAYCLGAKPTGPGCDRLILWIGRFDACGRAFFYGDALFSVEWRRGVLYRWGFLQDGMGIGSAVAEGIDACQPGFLLAWPGNTSGGNVDGRRAKVDIGVELLEVNAGQDFLILERESCLRQSQQASAGFDVPKIAFH